MVALRALFLQWMGAFEVLNGLTALLFSYPFCYPWTKDTWSNVTKLFPLPRLLIQTLEKIRIPNSNLLQCLEQFENLVAMVGWSKTILLVCLGSFGLKLITWTILTYAKGWTGPSSDPTGTLLACLLAYFPIRLPSKNTKLFCNKSQFQPP